MQAVARRMGRYVKLGAKAGTHVLRTGGIASIRHGVGVVGLTETAMRRVNRWTCRARGRMGGRSSFARLALSRFNPGHMFFLDPLRLWARSVWDATLPKHVRIAAWFNARETVCKSDAAMSAAEGAD